MLTAAQFDQIGVPIVDLYERYNLSVIADIARRLANMKMTSTAAWQMQRLIESGKIYEKALSDLSRMTGRSEAELDAEFQRVGVKALAFDDGIYKAAGRNPIPLNLSPAMRDVLEAGFRRTAGLMRNLTMTTALSGQQAFEAAADLAYMQVANGAMSYTQAIRAAVKDMAAQGLSIVRFDGHKEQLDVAIRRAVLTGVAQTTGNLQMARADEMGCDLVQTSAHQGARNKGVGPMNHESWQGRIFSRSGTTTKYPDFVASTGYGTITGLCGINCRHSWYPYFEGISENAYSAADLEAMAGKTVTLGGKQISQYEASQIQRRIERSIRHWKRQALALKAAGQDNSREVEYVRSWQARARAFAQETGLQRQGERESVYTPRGNTASPPPPAAETAQVQPPAIEPTSGPAGTPVSAAVDVSGLRARVLKKEAAIALGAIDKVHGDGALPKIPVKESASKHRFGSFLAFGPRPVNITLARSGNHKAFTLLHEMGHFLDHSAMSETWSSLLAVGDMKGVMEAIHNSSWVVDLEKRLNELNAKPNSLGFFLSFNGDYVRYLRKTRELFARAYAQYITLRSRDQDLLAQLKAMQVADFPIQWSDTDFDRIADALDALFRSKGWIS